MKNTFSAFAESVTGFLKQRRNFLTGSPRSFVRKKVYVMFANNHHNDGHVAVWLPVPPGSQATLVGNWPSTYFVPPYVGVKGWVGIELANISDEDLAVHITEAWRMIAPKKLTA